MRTFTRLIRRSYSSTSCNTNDTRLIHQHLSKHTLTPYAEAETLQETYRAQHLLFKSNPSSSPPPPPPYLISFESEPIYTFGRQQKATPPPSTSPSTPPSTSPLLEPLAVHLPQRQTPIQRTFSPKVSFTQRGGLTTYHGPGQLVLWPVLDIHSPRYAHFSVSSYAGFLEATTRRLLREVFGIETYISPDEPGVWVRGGSGWENGGEGPRKIAALGVHHRRYVTALGTAINVDVATEGGQEVNPWARFVPCGIEDKSVTSVVREMGPKAAGVVFDLGELARRWAGMFEEGLLDERKRLSSER